MLLNNFMVLISFLRPALQKPWKSIDTQKKILKKHVKVFCNKAKFKFNTKPMKLFPLPALPQPF